MTSHDIAVDAIAGAGRLDEREAKCPARAWLIGSRASRQHGFRVTYTLRCSIFKSL